MDKTNSWISYICLLLAYFMPGQAIELYGQVIHKHSKLSLEESYRQALNHRFTAKGASLADSLYRIAAETDDPKMQCDLLKLELEYLVTTNNIDKIREKSELMRSIAFNSHDEHNLFWSYRQQAKYLVDHGRLLELMDLTNEMKKDAEQMESVYGAYLMHLTVGDTYKACNDKDMAKEAYLQALNLQKRYLKDMDPTMSHVYLSEMYRRKSGRTQSDIDSCKLLLSEGLALTNDPMNRARLLSEEAMLYHSLQDYQSFNDTYKRIQAELKTDTLPDEFIQVYYRKKILDSDYEGAQKLIDRIPLDYDRHIAQYLLYKRQDDYKNAIISYENANHALNIIRTEQSRTNIEELNQRIGNLQLTIENQELQHKYSNIISQVLFVIFVIVLVALYFVIKMWNRAKKAGEELKTKNHELEQARDKAVHSEEMKTMFIQNMSHEIRTPLNAIAGFSDVLATQADELKVHEREEFAHLIRHNTELLTKLVNDILILSDVESGRYEMHYAKVAVNSFCRKVLESVRHRVIKNVELTYDTDVTDRFEICTDEVRLAQVLNNLLVNACKYTTAGSITLECHLKAGKIIFAVKDTGPGIPPERRSDIFERFTKLDNFHQGTGLGLNICLTIVNMMKGKIFVDEQYHDGSRFVIELPLEK